MIPYMQDGLFFPVDLQVVQKNAVHTNCHLFRPNFRRKGTDPLTEKGLLKIVYEHEE